MMKKISLILGLLLLFSCSKKLFKEKWTQEKAPTEFNAVFETTQGDFEIYAKRAWSPQGVDRLYSLIKNGFYSDIAIFRVVPNFVAQFGIHNDNFVNDSWEKYGLEDEPVIVKNDAMTIAFARGGQKTRTTQLFINLKNNNRLDNIDYSGVKGFPVVAKVTKGAENILNFCNKYGEKLGYRQDSILKYGNKFIRKNYPEIDFILKASIIK